ncbi:MAG: GNAT family N-acetyltransferase [Pseudomonadota bacterium]
MNALLDNIFWHTMTGEHARFTTGTEHARRFAPGFSPILGFRDAGRPDFAALAPFCEAGEHFYCDGWSGAPPEGWAVEMESTMLRMVWHGSAPEADAAPDAIALGPEHAQQALALATLTRPGPFGPRTPELGEYFGYVDGGRLVAMAGERMSAPGLREISGVCTDPAYQGRGMARQLVAKLVRRQLQRQQTPFLHVMRANVAAHELYLRMGFIDYLESVVRVVARQASTSGRRA